MSKPRFTKEAFEEGKTAYIEWAYERDENESLHIYTGDIAYATTPLPESGWPLYSPEGRAWYHGWNEAAEANSDLENMFPLNPHPELSTSLFMVL